MAQILVIEDNETMREGIMTILSRMGHEVLGASAGKEGVEMFGQMGPDFVITDLKMEDMDGLDVLTRIREISAETLVMIITAFGTIETAVEAMKIGAFDFITKPFPPDLLRVKVAKALDMVRMRTQNQFLRSEDQREHGQSLIGHSKVILDIREQMSRAAACDSTVLITGESGTGKEVVARALHRQGLRASEPFIKVDCSSLSEEVLESELFGHERGAFTGALRRKPGRFELADGGTIFLDEIGDISPCVQHKLLRVLQDRCFERVGGSQPLSVNVRVISATNTVLQEQLHKGHFRQDLYDRLHMISIHLPPLRDRQEDVVLLVDHFVRQLSKKLGRRIEVTDEALQRFQSYTWPGNVRELENLMGRIAVLSSTGTIQVSDLPEEMKSTVLDSSGPLPPTTLPLDEALSLLERRLILRACSQTKGVKSQAARLLGITTSALYHKLEKHGIAQHES